MFFDGKLAWSSLIGRRSGSGRPGAAVWTRSSGRTRSKVVGPGAVAGPGAEAGAEPGAEAEPEADAGLSEMEEMDEEYGNRSWQSV